jgi:hypothetical protein
MKHVADERNDFKARLETTLKDLEVATDPVMSKRWSEIVIRTRHQRIRPLIIRCARSYIYIVILDTIHLVPYVHAVI